MKDQNRDQAMDRLLRQRAARDRQEGPGVCLDADLLAAWADGALAAAERSAAEAHAADCARCQAVLATMVRAEQPALPVEPSGSLVRRWLTWLTPVAAAATAWALWVAVDQLPSAVEPRPAQSIARSPIPAPVTEADALAKDTAAAPADSRTASTPKEAERDSGDRFRQGEDKNERSRRTGARDDEKAAAKPAEGFVADAARRADVQERALAPVAGAVSAPAQAAPPPTPAPPSPAAPRPAAPPATVAETIAAPVGQTQQTPNTQAANAQAANTQAANTQSAQASARQSGQAAQKPLADQVVVTDARRGAGAGRGDRANEPAREESRILALYEAVQLAIVSPDPSVRWRVIGGRTLQRSIDGGLSWEATAAELPRPISAGVAPSPSVCWLVGENGLVMLTTDGRTWRQIAFPELVALARVQATDARSASVTTAGGQVFATGDGGRTWTKK